VPKPSRFTVRSPSRQVPAAAAANAGEFTALAYGRLRACVPGATARITAAAREFRRPGSAGRR
jgi:hypothetical protein